MVVEIVMPRLSDSMQDGTILQWLVAEGDSVQEGEPLVEVETDKASVTYESECAGTLLRISAQVGDSVAVGAIIATVGDTDEALADPASGSHAFAAAAVSPAQVSEPGAAAPPAQVSEPGAAAPPAQVSEPGAAAPPAQVSEPVAAVSPAPSSTLALAPATPATGSGANPKRVKASPLARRIAAELGVDLGTLVGSGPQGRVIRADVERSAAAVTPSSQDPAARATLAAVPGAEPSRARGETTHQPLSRLQQTVARRMAEARATVPDFELRCEVDMTRASQLREQMRDLYERPPSINDFVIKAAAQALREFPRVNGAYRDSAFEHYDRVNVGIAVAAEDALVVPTIFDADRRSLGEIARAARALAAKVRDGSITPAELSGGTFSISNLGMYGVDSFSAVINSPQAAILAVGSLKARPAVDDAGTIVARPTINLTLACDHRILYGADGARFLARLRELLEKPLVMLAE